MADPNQVQAEFLRKQMELSKALGLISNDLMTAVDKVATTSSKKAEDYEKSINELIKVETEAARQKREQLTSMYKAELEQEEYVKALDEQLQAAADAYRDSIKQQRDLHKEAAVVQADINRQKMIQNSMLSNEIGTIEHERIKQNIEALEKREQEIDKEIRTQQQFTQEIADSFKILHSHNAYATSELTAAIDERVQAERDAVKKHATVSGQVAQITKAGVKKMWAGILSMFDTAQGAKDVYATVKSEISSGMSLAFEDYLTSGFKLGLDTEELVRLNKANREYALAVAEGTTYQEILTKANRELEDSIADNSERTKFAAGQLKMLGDAGIRPSLDAFKEITDSYDNARKLTNMTAEEYTEAMQEIISSDSVQSELRRAATQQDRIAIIKGIQARMEENRAIGLSTRQNIESAKALARLAGREDPLDRFKQAAQLRAFGAAMGMQNTDVMVKVMQQGIARSTEREKTLAERWLQEANALRAQAATDQNLGREFFVSSLTKNLNLDDLINSMSVFNIQGARALSIEDKQIEALGEVNKSLKSMVTDFGRIASGIKTSGVQAGGGLIIDIATLLGTGGLGAVLGSKFKGLFGGGATVASAAGMGGGAAAAGAGKTAAMMGGITSKLGDVAQSIKSSVPKLVKGAGVLGGAVNVVSGAMDVAEGKNLEGYARIGGTIAGGLLGVLGGPAGIAAGTLIGGEAAAWVARQFNSEKEEIEQGKEVIIKDHTETGNILTNVFDMKISELESKLSQSFYGAVTSQNEYLLALNTGAIIPHNDQMLEAMINTSMNNMPAMDMSTTFERMGKDITSGIKTLSIENNVNKLAQDTGRQMVENGNHDEEYRKAILEKEDVLINSTLASGDKISTSNELLANINQNIQKSLELSERQLVASTLTEKEKQSDIISLLRLNNSFFSSYRTMG